MYQKNYVNIISAICHFQGEKCLDNGYAILTQYPDKTIIRLDLYNLPPGRHGFHIHELSDLRNGCNSLGSHYNPFNHNHGNLNQLSNHLGDLGNITIDSNGRSNEEIVVKFLPLTGKYGVVGRSMIIHEKADDYGLCRDPESKKSGNSGKRISCGIIGYL